MDDFGARETARRLWDLGWWPLTVKTDTKAPAVRGHSGHSRPSTGEMEAWLDTVADGAALAVSMPIGVVGLDVDTYAAPDGSGAAKRGGAELQRLESELGPLPETWMSTRRGPQPSTGPERTGIYFFQLPAWAVQSDSEELVKLQSAPAPGIETVQYHERIAVCCPTVLDGMPYRWYGPRDRTDLWDVVDGARWRALPPRPEDLPVLPLTWVQALYRSGLSRADGAPVPRGMASVGELLAEWSERDGRAWAAQDRRMRKREPGPADGGGASGRSALPRAASYRAMELDEALAWAASAVPGWSDEPNDFVRGKVEAALSEFGRGGSRHDATRDAAWHLLWLCAGDSRTGKPANAGGDWALQRVCSELIDARDRDCGGIDAAAREEVSRLLVHAIAKLRADSESGRVTIADDVYGRASVAEWDSDLPDWRGNPDGEDPAAGDFGAWDAVDWAAEIDGESLSVTVEYDPMALEDVPLAFDSDAVALNSDVDALPGSVWGNGWSASGGSWYPSGAGDGGPW